MSRETVCFSMYSLMSKRRNSTPSAAASCFATSVLPTPVGPQKRNEPTGLSCWPSPARARRIAETTVSTAISWPNTSSLMSRSSVCRRSRSDVVTCRGGIFAMVATMCSMSRVRTVFFCRPVVWLRAAAPASSITSMALSGRNRSSTCLAARPAHARRDDGLQTRLELAAGLRAREQGAHVERVDLDVAQRGRDAVFLHAERESLDDGRLPDARIADVDRVVLPPAAEDVDGALELARPSDQRVDAPRGRALDQVDGEGGERIARPPGATLLI